MTLIYQPPSGKVMKQVELRRNSNTQVCWIEERGAKLNAVVELKLGDGVRSPGWQVTKVFGSQSEEAVLAGAVAHKYHRSRTDI